MNLSKLKTYAPKARRDFIRAMTDRAAIYGLTEKTIEPVTEKGDVAIITGKAYPISVAAKRKLLDERVKRQGFDQVMEAMAYTWFNRFAAIRFMELHGYLDHGYRVLSHPEGKSAPEIVEHAEHVDLPGLDKSWVIELKLDGTKEAELYRMLLIAQCNALHSAMPFLFERINDETELLLPDNLLHSDSLIRQLVNEIDEADWQPVEIIGWLYQFYISEKKDEVIGSVVKSEDIPAATQLFTPNWIVKYLAQNSLGRQWLATYPHSPLRQQMEYYIEPVEQTPEVQAQLKAITPTELNPEELTLMDPACGSGHILVEGYDIFKAIYQERGYRAKDIPRLILEKNLFGLEIDDRAAQLAAFALMMKARADDRRIFDSEVKPNILAFQDSQGMNAADITHALNSPINKEEKLPSEYLIEEIEDEKTPLFSEKALAEKGHVSQGDIASLLELFENATTFGSLIQVPPKLAAQLPEIRQRLDDVLKHGNLTHTSAAVIAPLLLQARLLAQRYDAVVANPPYMGSRHMNALLKDFVAKEYPRGKADLFAAFIEWGLTRTTLLGRNAMVTMQSWLFLSSFEGIRQALLSESTLECMVHMANGVMGIAFGTAATVWNRNLHEGYKGAFSYVEYDDLTDDGVPRPFPVPNARLTHASSHDFRRLPGQPIAYWVSEAMRTAFETGIPLGDLAFPCQGMATTNNGMFVRHWSEVDDTTVAYSIRSPEEARLSNQKWFPYNKGGEYRKWYGNNRFLVNYENDGKTLCDYIDNTPGAKVGSNGRVINRDKYFLPSVTWSFVSSSFFGVRRSDPGFIFDVGGSSAFPPDDLRNLVVGFLCSRVAFEFMRAVNPTLNFQAGNVSSLPVAIAVLQKVKESLDKIVEELVSISRSDWDSFETSWDFVCFPLLDRSLCASNINDAYAKWRDLCDKRFRRMQELEERNNQLFIDAYGMRGELSPVVAEEQITLYRPNCEEDIGRLISYSIGCMMGRYSLDKPGLVYAESGNKDFDPTQYKTFAADQDGIIPLTDTAWFDDDGTNRVIEFIGVAWPKEHLEENVKFIAESLGTNKGEQPRDTIRRYLAQDFFKDHLKTYKRRPIYWLFSSGKQRAFQCLVYLHRYNEGTLSRMRTEYVIPLQGKMSARIEQLAGDIAAATSTAFRSKLTKERDKLIKQQAELQSFDDRLRHYADLRINLDLDDGVKVNYGKFGDLLAEVKAISGGGSDE